MDRNGTNILCQHFFLKSYSLKNSFLLGENSLTGNSYYALGKSRLAPLLGSGGTPYGQLPSFLIVVPLLVCQEKINYQKHLVSSDGTRNDM